MSKRLDPKLWLEVAKMVDKGGLCAYCAKPLPQPLNNRDVPRGEWTSINHIDGNEQDWRIENLNLMSIHCNNSYRADLQRRAKLQYLLNLKTSASLRSSTVSEERESNTPDIPRFRIVPASSDAYSNRKSHECRPVYQRHIFATMVAGYHHRPKIFYQYDELNDDGANMVGEITNTTGRYLNILLSRSGPLDNPQDETSGKNYIIFKHPEYYWLTVDELMEMFPIEGMKAADEKRTSALVAIAEERMQAAIQTSQTLLTKSSV